MALQDLRIQLTDYAGKDMEGFLLPSGQYDSADPGPHVRQFDKLVKELVAVRFNALIAALVSTTDGISGMDVLGLTPMIPGGTTSPQALLEFIYNTLQYSWFNVSEVWNYTGVDNPTGVLAIAGNVTAKYFPGMRIKFTNNGNLIYGIVTKVEFTNPNTAVYFLHEIDPATNLAKTLMTNAAITNPAFSAHKAPAGFPLDPKKWTLRVVVNTLVGYANPAISTYYNIASINLDIGEWLVVYEAALRATRAATGTMAAYCVLSTSNSSPSDVDFRSLFLGQGTEMYIPVKREKAITVSAKSTFGLYVYTPASDITWLGLAGSNSTTVIQARCAYL